MKLFTPRFIKDLLIIIVLGSLLYGLTHNSITHPQLSATTGSWSIQLMQHPLIFGIAGHNYLVLRDDKNAIEKELHGLATDSTTSTWKYVGNDPKDILKVWEFNDPTLYAEQKGYPGVTLYKGDRNEAMMLWGKGEICKEEINNKNIPYPPYGVNMGGDTENSNSVAYTLTLCMGLDAQHLGLITPGWGKNLLESN
jgi:hypothetical protein